MAYPHRPAAAAPNGIARVDTGRWTVRKATATPRIGGPVRRYDAMALLEGEGVVEVSRTAPAHPAFEAAFSALARGTIMATSEGPVAIEDLLPGMKIETRDAGFQPLLWIGTITLVPNGAGGLPPARLFRVPAESFGPARPMPDLVLAPHARLLHRSPKLRGVSADETVLTPVGALEDGTNVIRVAPFSPVRVYHIAFAEHHILRANGIDIESFHPGANLAQQLSDDSIRLFLSFFPHISRVSGFGPQRMPRLTAEEFATVTAA